MALPAPGSAHEDFQPDAVHKSTNDDNQAFGSHINHASMNGHATGRGGAPGHGFFQGNHDEYGYHDDENGEGARRRTARAFGGALQPGIWRPYEHRKLANPAPLGLSAFALTTFVLSCVNLHIRGIEKPNIVVPLAFGYGGVVQLLAGMWEIAVGNTFGATALSSYGGFWIAYGLLQSPTWAITSTDSGPYTAADQSSAVGFFLTGWFVFTTLLLLCTLRSTVAFFSLFFILDLAFLCLACEEFAAASGAVAASDGLRVAGGVFGMLAAFLAWYNALAGLQDESNSFFRVPVVHMPWSERGREIRKCRSRVKEGGFSSEE